MSLCGKVSGLKLGFTRNTFCVKQVQKHYISISQNGCHVENFHMAQLFHRSVGIHIILTLKVISGLFCPNRAILISTNRDKRKGCSLDKEAVLSVSRCLFSDIRAQKKCSPRLVILTSPSHHTVLSPFCTKP